MSTGIAKAIGNLSPTQPRGRSNAQALRLPGAQTVRRSDAQTPKRSELALQGTAKSKHLDFQKKNFYVRKSTMRDAMRRYEDEGGVEQSELVEMLLRNYAGGKHG